MVGPLWNQLIHIPEDLPTRPPLRRLWLVTGAIGCILCSIFYLATYLLLYSTDQLPVQVYSVSAYGLRAMLAIGVAGWSLRGINVHINTRVEQRQGRFIATIYVLLMILTIVGMSQDRGPLPLVAKLAYTVSTVSFYILGYIFVRHGRVRTAGVLLLIGCVIELFASMVIDNAVRRAALPYVDILAILIAALLVRWWIGLFLSISLPLAGAFLQSIQLAPGTFQVNALIAVIIYQFTIAALAALYARSLESALTLADERALRLEHESAAREREAAERARVEAYATQAADLATLEERNRIAREIHDGLGHHLMDVLKLLKGSRTVLASDPKTARESLEEAYTVAKDALDDVRRSVGTLRGSLLEQQTLGEVVTKLVQKTATDGIDATWTILGEPRTLALPVAETLYRVTQEALTNIRKHAQATQAVVQLDYRDPQRVRLLIEDNGRGTDHPHGGFGLIGMRERIRQIDGALTLETAPGQGFYIQVEVAA